MPVIWESPLLTERDRGKGERTLVRQTRFQCVTLQTSKGGLLMNRSEVLKILEWVDQTAKDGDVARLVKAKQALEAELGSKRNLSSEGTAYKTAIESFVRKHGREPMEEVVVDD